MIHLLVAALFPVLASASPSAPALFVTAELQRGGELIAFTLDAPAAAGGSVSLSPSLLLPGSLAAALPPAGPGSSVNSPEQSLVTTIQDPTNPDEPWIVTTYRKPGESHQGFVKRHRDMVVAVRDALGAD